MQQRGIEKVHDSVSSTGSKVTKVTKVTKVIRGMILRTIIFYILFGATAACIGCATHETTLDPIMPLAFEEAGDLPLTVWETCKEPFESFTEPGLWEQSGAWNSPRLRPSSKTGARHLLGYPEGMAEYGFEGSIPPHCEEDNPKPVDIYRVTQLPDAVQAINRKYQHHLMNSAHEKSVFAYYQLIGTQNPRAQMTAASS